MSERKLLILALSLILKRRVSRRLKNKAKRRFWVRQIYQQREEKGAYHNIIQELRLFDRENHFR